MSIELSMTQPVNGDPRKDKLGLTLRERLWLTRAALLAMVLSGVTSAVLLTLLPVDPRGPSGPMQVELAERSSRPIVHVPAVAPLPLPDVQRPTVSAETEPELAPLATPAAPSKPARTTSRVVVTRGRINAVDLPASRAVDLSAPQPLAAPRKPPPEPVHAAPAAEPELKRPSFE